MKFEQKISCIIPAYNESSNIGRVLKVIQNINWIDEIIIVDDCSEDETLAEVQKHGLKNLRTFRHKQNLGKGAAMATGIKAAKHDLFLFLDSDLLNLKEEHILKILSPIVFTKEADLSLGVFALKKLKENTSTKFANRMFPAITGQRAVWRDKLPPLDKIAKSRYGVDLLITKHIPRGRRAVVKLDNLAQVKKEEKTDVLFEAVKSRIKMYQEVLKIAKKFD